MKRITTAFCMFYLACGAGETPPGTGSVPIYEPALRGTIGVELGDSSYVFGWIQSVDFLDDGSILVLDRAACGVKMYSPEGTYIMMIGRRGSGPGELMNPLDMYATEDGRVMVCTPWSGGMHGFDREGNWLGLVTPFLSNPPMMFTGSDGGSFSALRLQILEAGDGFDCVVFIGRYQEGSEEPSVVFWETRFPFDPMNLTQLLRHSLFGHIVTSDRQGNVFIAHLGTDYVVEGFRRDGERFLVIERQAPLVEKTPDEIREEREWVEGYLRSMEASGVVLQYNPDSYRDAIAELKTDYAERLWIRRGTEQGPIFDVFDYQGVHLFTAAMPEMEGTMWDFRFGPEVIAAYPLNPDGWQMLYIIEYPTVCGDAGV